MDDIDRQAAASEIARLRAENEQQRDMLLESARQRRELEAQLAVAVGALKGTNDAEFTIHPKGECADCKQVHDEVDDILATLPARAADLLAVVEAARVTYRRLCNTVPNDMDELEEALAKIDGTT